MDGGSKKEFDFESIGDENDYCTFFNVKCNSSIIVSSISAVDPHLSQNPKLSLFPSVGPPLSNPSRCIVLDISAATFSQAQNWLHNYLLQEVEILCLVMQRHFTMSADPALVEEDASSGSGEDLNMLDGHSKHQTVTPNSVRRKRSRKATGDAIVDAMLEIAAASKMRAAAIMRNEERFAISKCIKVLDEMQGVDQSIYFFALDLFENSNARETFISLKNERRLIWLQCKYNAANAAN